MGVRVSISNVEFSIVCAKHCWGLWQQARYKIPSCYMGVSIVGGLQTGGLLLVTSYAPLFVLLNNYHHDPSWTILNHYYEPFSTISIHHWPFWTTINHDELASLFTINEFFWKGVNSGHSEFTNRQSDIARPFLFTIDHFKQLAWTISHFSSMAGVNKHRWLLPIDSG